MTTDSDEGPPVLGSWGAVYALVLIVLAALIAGFVELGLTYR